MSNEMTKEEKAAEKAAAREAKKAQAQAEKDAKKAEREAHKAAKLQAKQDAQQAREDARAAKVQVKADAKAAREANRQPEQNGMRRPSPNGKTGRVWLLIDTMTAIHGSTVSVSELLAVATAEGIAEATVRSQYAYWKKFHGLTKAVTA